MPELPEVEVKRQYIDRTSLGLTIAGVHVHDDRVLDSISPSLLGESLHRLEFTKTRRRGKYILLSTSVDKTLLVHFGMSGDIFFTKKSEPQPKWTRVVFDFDNGASLNYTSMRLFGKISLYGTTQESEIPDIAKLGPEPLGKAMNKKTFEAIITSHNTTIHQLLMEQELIAGIGNIYSDEITYQAGILPFRKTGELADSEIGSLFDRMKWVLRTAIKLNADLDGKADKFIIPNRKKGGCCPRGHGALLKKTIGGRTSYYCPVCQQ